MTVRLENGTIGKVHEGETLAFLGNQESFGIGDTVMVELHDENGNTVADWGKIVEIL